ncbi:MAG TPA: ABC transporter ATP-binding protein [Nitrososphaeraceae archaeon]|jgi:ABC-2 type transport system ATP-binding protein
MNLAERQNDYCISVQDLRKDYGKEVHAIDGITFNVKYGRVFGFLGPNGAGKTTTIKVLTTLTQPTSGTVSIFGEDIVKHGIQIRRRIGVVFQQPSFEASLTVEKSLELYSRLWKVSSTKREQKLIEILRTFDLESIKNTKNDELSIGQRRRVQVAREFMHDMDLLFLDEPTVGLDPAARRSLLDYIKNQVKSGLTVFFTTHIMEEAEYLCDEIAIIDKGVIIAFDTPAGLKQKYGIVKNIELGLKVDSAESVVELISAATTAISRSQIEITGLNTLSVKADNPEEVIVELIKILSKNNIQIESISINPPSLEEVFLTIVNQKNDLSR